ncbi:MAG TPA: VWA domain-containing protein [Bryobacteraceae bacterium]|nr:VWA domain-containing protein [Bryobacteraceae bacterium]
MISFRFTGICLAGAALLFGQATAPRTGDAVIRVSVDLVEVDALVTDSKGRHVPDLKPEDFTILEDGKPQKITQFSFVNPLPAADAGTQKLTAFTGETRTAPAHTLRRENVHRTIVLMVDNLHTHSEGIVQLAPVLRKFAEEQVQPGDLVSVMGTKSGMGLYESFTSDRRQLDVAIEKVLRITGDNRPQETSDNSELDGTNYYSELYLKMAMNALRRAIVAMKDIPGKKTIMFFSNGILLPPPGKLDDSATAFRMSDETKQLTALANRYGVVLNAFDPGGIMTPMSTTRPMGGMPSRSQMGLAPGSRMGGLPTNSALLQRADGMALNEIPAFLARETGGVSIRNTNDIGRALGQAMDEMTGYYLIAYQPSNGSDKEHRIQVKVNRPGLHVRSRKGYAGALEEAEEKPAATREEQLAQALFSPFAADGIDVQLTPLYSASAPEKDTGRRQPLLRVTVVAAGKDLQFVQTPEGGKQAVLDVVVAAYDASDEQVAAQDHRYTLQATDAQAEAFRNGTVNYQVDLPIPASGPYQVRAAVRDDATGKAGSAYTFLAIPDFNHAGMSLSSLVVGDLAGTEAQVALRKFAPGGQLSYGCRLYGVQTGPDSAVDIEVKLFREGHEVYGSQPMRLQIPAGIKEIPVTGKLNLTSRFLPGEYAMEFIAHDRQASIDRRTWMDFSIAAQ